ncbi:MAG: hypothetical protein HKO54_00100 [Flavobacteriaceae bacterium]|nr:hypothetical protein [Flavobacteriaceae bacterium]
MKSFGLKIGMLTILSISLLVTSCSKDETATVADESPAITADQTRQTAEAEMTTDEVLSIVEMAYAENEEDDGRTASLFTDCVTITISFENGVTFVTLDFGFGCQLNNGAIVSGIINLTYGPVVAGTRTITVVFEDFTYNSKEVAGGATIYRERNNANGNPQSTVNKDLQITFPSGVIANVTGTRVAEWIEGVGSGTWMDNVFLITGDRQIEVSTGFTHDALVTVPLRREATCPHFVSGEIEITRNNGNGNLDFGDGTCDNIAILTVNGVEITIILN